MCSNTFDTYDQHYGRGLLKDSIKDGLAKFFHNGVSLRKDAVSASIRRVQRILRWFESQQQLAFYASSLLFVYEGLPSSSSPLSSLLGTPSMSPTAGHTATLSSAGHSDQRGEGDARPEGARQEEEVAEFNNNNNIQAPWDYSLETIYTNHRKGGHQHCAKGCLGNSGDGDGAETKASLDSAPCEEDNSAWKRTGESLPAPNANGNKSQLEGKGEDGEGGRRREEEELKGRGGGATEGAGGDTEVEVRMIDFAHVFPSECHDRGYSYGLRHLLMVLEQILCDTA
ncbi:inositol polyphosphate multikinase [Notothenia coriiceps]|uniref:Kinase n=1 Tax=Notothenia coriiceps TaxID=8208 RepID=A0A6I9NQ57_9TELE|nr:PREDICTED: inositol polyphosphate multikinase [Notothenia coriiceps]